MIGFESKYNESRWNDHANSSIEMVFDEMVLESTIPKGLLRLISIEWLDGSNKSDFGEVQSIFEGCVRGFLGFTVL